MSAICFNLDQSKILSSGNGLKICKRINVTGGIEALIFGPSLNPSSSKGDSLWHEKAFWKHYRKRRNCGQPSSPFPTMFSTLTRRNFTIWATVTFLSANDFSLDKAEILLPRKNLICSAQLLFTIKQSFRLLQIESSSRQENKCNSKIEVYTRMSRKHCGKRRKCWLPAFFFFSNNFFKSILS